MFHSQKINSQKTQIALTTKTGCIFVQVNDILRCESDNSYTNIYFTDKTVVLVSKPISKCEAELEKFGFIRVHKKHLVNCYYIKKYVRQKHSYLIMADDSKIEISKEKVTMLFQQINKI